MAGPRHSLAAVRMMLAYRADRRMWRLAVVAVLVAVLILTRTEGARISLPNPDAGDREGRHWLDQADDMRGAPGGSAEGSEKDHNGPDDGPDPPWWFASYVMLHESIRQGRSPARYVVWTCSSLLGEAAPGMHGTSATRDAAWKTDDIFNAPNHVGPRPSRFARDGDYLGCAWYGNRLYGIGTSLLYALITGELTLHACSASVRLSVYALVSACACVLRRFYVYHLDHKRLRHLLGCRSRLDGGYVPSKTSKRICICTLNLSQPHICTPHKQTGRCSSTGPDTQRGCERGCANWCSPAHVALTGGWGSNASKGCQARASTIASHE
jgi:hypothetical protein